MDLNQWLYYCQKVVSHAFNMSLNSIGLSVSVDDRAAGSPREPSPRASNPSMLMHGLDPKGSGPSHRLVPSSPIDLVSRSRLGTVIQS